MAPINAGALKYWIKSDIQEICSILLNGLKSVITALIKQARKLPKDLYQSLTWDRGSEMTDHAKFTTATKIDV